LLKDDKTAHTDKNIVWDIAIILVLMKKDP